MEIAVTVLAVVDSWQGHTLRVAKCFLDGLRSVGGRPVLRTADEATRADVLAADAFVMGSAVHQRDITWKMKRVVDEICEPAWFYVNLVGRVGAEFTASGGHGQAGGGAERAQLEMLANLAACGMVLLTLPKCTPGFEQSGLHWGPTIRTTTEEMRAIVPSALDSEALQVFFHQGAKVVRVAQRLRNLELATGNRWPSLAERNGRNETERNRPAQARLPHPTDPAGAY